MKSIILMAFSLLTYNVFANEVYNCNFNGPDYTLTFQNNEAITLKNSFNSYECQSGFETFPGTEVDLRTLLCSSKNSSLKFYFTQYSDSEIILSRNSVFAKDISCKK